MPYCRKLFNIMKEDGLLLKHSNKFEKEDWEEKMGKNAPKWMIDAQTKLQETANEHKRMLSKHRKEMKEARKEARKKEAEKQNELKENEFENDESSKGNVTESKNEMETEMELNSQFLQESSESESSDLEYLGRNIIPFGPMSEINKNEKKDKKKAKGGKLEIDADSSSDDSSSDESNNGMNEIISQTDGHNGSIASDDDNDEDMKKNEMEIDLELDIWDILETIDKQFDEIESNSISKKFANDRFVWQSNQVSDGKQFEGKFENGERLARLIAKYRDSSYYSNYANNYRFIKIGETSQSKREIYENLIHVLNFAPTIVANGGLDNVMRMSLHLNNSTIQLPFYHNSKSNPCFTIIDMSQNSNERKSKLLEMVAIKRLRNELNMKTKIAMQHAMPIANLSNVKHLEQCKLPKQSDPFSLK